MQVNLINAKHSRWHNLRLFTLTSSCSRSLMATTGMEDYSQSPQSVLQPFMIPHGDNRYGRLQPKSTVRATAFHDPSWRQPVRKTTANVFSPCYSLHPRVRLYRQATSSQCRVRNAGHPHHLIRAVSKLNGVIKLPKYENGKVDE